MHVRSSIFETTGLATPPRGQACLQTTGMKTMMETVTQTSMSVCVVCFTSVHTTATSLDKSKVLDQSLDKSKVLDRPKHFALDF